MGCDIHLYLEYSTWEDTTGHPYWTCLIENGGSRDYQMFGLLAGVRDGCFEPIAQPRGLPEGKLSYQVHDAEFIRIAPNDKPEQAEWDGYTSRETAMSWAGYGSVITGHQNNPELPVVTNPDHHSHSWITVDELAMVLGRYMTQARDIYNVEWDAYLAAARALEERGAKVRFIFWFDN